MMRRGDIYHSRAVLALCLAVMRGVRCDEAVKMAGVYVPRVQGPKKRRKSK